MSKNAKVMSPAHKQGAGTQNNSKNEPLAGVFLAFVKRQSAGREKKANWLSQRLRSK
jgi:hypothetical protein